MLTKLKSFLVRTAIAAKDKVVSFGRACVQHTEAAGILVLSAVGLNALLGELPFYVMLPAWIEVAMVMPVASVFIVGGLVRSAEFRAKRRLVAA